MSQALLGQWTWLLVGLLVGNGAEGSGSVELWAFTSPTCGPCRQMEPILGELAARGVPIRRIDVTRQGDLARQLGIQAVPTVLAVSAGRVLGRTVGLVPAETIEKLWRQAGGGVPVSVPGPGVSSTGWGPGQPESDPQASVGVIPISAPSRGSAAGSSPSEPGTRDDSPPLRAVGQAEASDAPSGVRDYARTVADLLQATVRLRVRDGQGQSCGSGTIVDARGGEALILTCGHIFRESKGAGRIEVDLFGPQPAENVVGRLVGYDLTRDLGLVAIRPPGPVMVARIAPAGKVLRPGMAVVSVGCDHGSRPKAYMTRITAVDKFVGPANVVVAGMPSEGRSGGGLFSEDGCLVGVCNAADPADKEGLFSALPAIHELLDQRGLAFVYRGPFPPALGVQLAGATAGPAERATAGGSLPASNAGVAEPVAVAQATGQKSTEWAPPSLPSGQAPAGGSDITPAEEALLARLAQQIHQGAEVLWVIRPRDEPVGGGEVHVLEKMSPGFWARLAELGQRLPQRTSCQTAESPAGGSGPTRGRVIFEYRAQ